MRLRLVLVLSALLFAFPASASAKTYCVPPATGCDQGSNSVEEALYLSDRVAVLSARPARIVAELPSPAPRAEDRDAAVTAPEFVAAREQAMAALKAGSR